MIKVTIKTYFQFLLKNYKSKIGLKTNISFTTNSIRETYRNRKKFLVETYTK
jgi:hypothetical protein